MTINFFLQSRDFGGAEQFAHDLLVELAKQGQEVHIYTSNQFLLDLLLARPRLSVHRIPIYLDFVGNWRGLIKSFLLTPLAVFYYFFNLAKIKQRHDKQVVVCSGFSEKIIVAPLSKLLSLKVFFIEYGPLEPLFRILLGIPKWLYSISKRFATRVIVPSHNTLESLRGIFDETEMIVIACGTRASLPVPAHATHHNHALTVVSRLEQGKGQDLAIRAFALVSKKFPDAKLLIVGRGSFESELKRLSADNPQIQFLEYVADKTSLLLESEIILCPSVWPLEGFGLTIIEAMALGKPIVAFDRAPGNEMLTDGQNALLARDGDYLDLATKILELLENHDLQKKLGEQAREDFKKHYSIEEVSKKYLALLQN